MVKDSGKTTMRNSKAKNKVSVDCLEYTVMAIEIDDPMDKMLKAKTSTIQKLTNLISLTDKEIIGR